MTDLLQNIALAVLGVCNVLHAVALRRHVEYQQRLIEKLLHDRHQPHGDE